MATFWVFIKLEYVHNIWKTAIDWLVRKKEMFQRLEVNATFLVVEKTFPLSMTSADLTIWIIYTSKNGQQILLFCTFYAFTAKLHVIVYFYPVNR